MKKLKRMSRNNIEFLGQLTDEHLLGYYQRCQAVIFPQEEDFGLVPLEAQSCGRPVIAFRGGGALETVVEGKTGLFFTPQSPAALIKAVKRFDPNKFQPQDCYQNAAKFSSERFKQEMIKFVDKQWKKKS